MTLKRTFVWVLLACCTVVGCDQSFWYRPLDPNGQPDNRIVQPDNHNQTRAFRLLILEDSNNRSSLTSGQRDILTSGLVRSYLKEHCAKGSSGQPEFRILHYTAKLDGIWADVVQKNPKPEGSSYPWMWVTDGVSAGYTGPPGEDLDRFMLTIKPYAEGK